ncbi:hypothetical protein [Nodularia chucula]|uniref:hypothetical protein n=1 Tax=Nodularia chucula TaxID=3093667 RepID=UPI0039C65FAA
MAVYCQEGETARVTFPDGEILDYLNTPIRVEVEEHLHLYRAYTALELWGDNAAGGYKISQSQGYSNIWARPSELNNPYFKNYITSPGNNREYSAWITAYLYSNSANETEIFLRGYSTPRNPLFVKPWFAYQAGTQWFEMLPYLQNVPGFDPKYTISVFDKDDLLLTLKVYNSDEYFVDCLGCPPRHINCQPCCLPCDSTFNSISSIRELIYNDFLR